ncbi:MAG: hypothetical protein JWR38_389 [Mucilaginibacter sp.]|nr:hypothetical protein [Mucilaginibacter sp.]
MSSDRAAYFHHVIARNEAIPNLQGHSAKSGIATLGLQ